jgi:hypothetical protein
MVESSTRSKRRPCLHVEEMIKKAVIAGDVGGLWSLRRVPEEAKRREHALARRVARYPTVLDADRVRREREANRGDARKRFGRPAIRRQTAPGIRRLPEEIERAARERVDERALRRRRTVAGRGGRAGSRRAGRGAQTPGERTAHRDSSEHPWHLPGPVGQLTHRARHYRDLKLQSSLERVLRTQLEPTCVRDDARRRTECLVGATPRRMMNTSRRHRH